MLRKLKELIRPGARAARMRGLRQAVRLWRVAQGLLVSSSKNRRGGEKRIARTLQALPVFGMPDEVC